MILQTSLTKVYLTMRPVTIYEYDSLVVKIRYLCLFLTASTKYAVLIVYLLLLLLLFLFWFISLNSIKIRNFEKFIFSNMLVVVVVVVLVLIYLQFSLARLSVAYTGTLFYQASRTSVFVLLHRLSSVKYVWIVSNTFE